MTPATRPSVVARCIRRARRRFPSRATRARYGRRTGFPAHPADGWGGWRPGRRMGRASHPAASSDAVEHLVGDVVVGVDVLHVVAVLEGVDEPEDLARGLLVE